MKNLQRIKDCKALAVMLTYDEATGKLVWKSGYGGGYSGREAGHVTDRGYIRVNHKRRGFLAHILAWVIVTGDLPEHEIDHINGVSGDNRWCNLRSVTREINQRNVRRKRSKNVAIAGVVRNAAKWSVTCRHERVGQFHCLGQAIKARRVEEARVGGFTKRHSLR
tara:strand:- start:244 stop:738 length:495 start_codon:yes stop_codon:yes gene_type:complete